MSRSRSAWTNPVRKRALRYLGTARRAIRQDFERQLALHRVVYCGDHVVLASLANGRLIYLDMRDASVAPLIAMGEPWEPHVTKALAALARPGDVFFDVGANVGFHSLMLRDRIAVGDGQLHLFEPNPSMHRLLERTFAANSFWRGIHVERIALSDDVGEATLTVYEDLWGGARLQDPADLASSHHDWASNASLRERFSVPTTTVDRYCLEHRIDAVDLMKIDTEGHEQAVFAGMTDTIGRSSDLKVVLEFTFGAYADSEHFWGDLSSTFPYRYLLDRSGAVVRVDSLTDLQALVDTELADIVLSKSDVSATLGR